MSLHALGVLYHEAIDFKRTGEDNTSHRFCSRKAFRLYVSGGDGHNGHFCGILASSKDSVVPFL